MTCLICRPKIINNIVISFYYSTTTAYKWWNCQVLRPANCCQHILPNRFLVGFPDPSQFAAAKLTHYSSKPHRPSDSSRSWQRILFSGDVHLNPGPTTKYPCPVCARNVTSRGVSYLCNRCSGWVHSKCFWSSKRSRV